MSAGINDEPDDDPYGYLYRRAPGESADEAPQPPDRGLTQYVQVGQARPGQTQAYGTPAYGPPPPAAAPTQAIPQQQPGGPGDRRTAHGGGGGGMNRNVLLGIGAAVVALVVVIVVIVSMSGGGSGSSASSSPSASSVTSQQSQSPSTSASAPSAGPSEFGTTDAKDAAPSGGAVVGPDGKVNMSAQGSTITWTFNAPSPGTYYLAGKYLNPATQTAGPDGKRTFVPLVTTINGKVSPSSPLKLYAFGTASGETGTYGQITLVQGQNTVSLTCSQAGGCPVTLDSFYLSDTKPTF